MFALPWVRDILIQHAHATVASSASIPVSTSPSSRPLESGHPRPGPEPWGQITAKTRSALASNELFANAPSLDGTIESSPRIDSRDPRSYGPGRDASGCSASSEMCVLDGEVSVSVVGVGCVWEVFCVEAYLWFYGDRDRLLNVPSKTWGIGQGRAGNRLRPTIGLLSFAT